MADIFSKKKRSQIMSKIRSKDSKIEVAFRKKLWEQGIRYRKNSPKYFGRPDLVLKKYKAVMFVDSCFWHGCALHFRLPGTRVRFWKEKISRNIERDKEVSRHYKKIGWRIYRVWEHKISKNIDLVVRDISMDIKQPH